MVWVPEQGITARELERRARTRPNWDGMRRWGYVCLEPARGDHRLQPPASSLTVRATEKGRRAGNVWGAVIPEIEGRWRERFGSGAVDALRRALIAMVSGLDPRLPDCMPILRFGLETRPARHASCGSPPTGFLAQEAYGKLAEDVEKRWAEQFGSAVIAAMRSALESLVGDVTANGSPLFAGLEPYPEGWRAQIRRPETLPHFPMVLHRGGYPDGS